MVASEISITDLPGKAIICRNYRGNIPLTKAIEQFSQYLKDVDDEACKKPVFFVDANNSDVLLENDLVGTTGIGGDTYVYVQVSPLKKS